MKNITKLLSLLLALTLLFTACTTDDSKDKEDKEVENTTEQGDSKDADTKSDEEDSNMYSADEIAAFDKFLEETAFNSIAESPINASFKYGDLDAVGLGHLRAELDDFSIETFEAAYDETAVLLETLHTYDYNMLPRDRQISYDMLEFSLEVAVEEEPFLYNYHQFQPSSGAQVNVPLSLSQIELETEQEVKDYLVRLTKLDDLFDQTLEYTEIQAEKGYLLPSSSYLTVIEQIEGMITTPETFMLYPSFAVQVDALGLDTETADAYKAECLTIIETEIFPAYDRIKVVLAEVADKSTITGGISQWDNGADYYEHLLKSKTSYDITAEEYRSLLQGEIMKNTTRIQALISKYPDLQTMDFEAMLPDINSYDEIYALQDAILAEEFLDYGIENASQHIIPAYLDDYLAGGFYFPVSYDGSDYGNMFLPQEAYDTPDAATLETYYHENIPGHHLYFARLYESDLPLIRKELSWLPFEEGWAVYVQGKAYNYMDLDESIEKFFYYLGNINSYTFAMLDIQLHVDGTSYDDMIAYLVTLGLPEDSAKETVDRMIANPGENIHYMYGYYKINQYRIDTMNALGDAFDFKSYHDMILAEGSVPFYAMDEIVDAYVETQTAN